MSGESIDWAVAALMTGTILAGLPAAALAQTAPPPAVPTLAAPPVAAPAPERLIRSLRVEGSQRVEPDTILSYTKLRVGQPYTNESVDQAIKDLLASDLLADVSIAGVESGDLVIRIRENPIINRVVLEGNKRLKNDKIEKEIKLKPRQVFSRTGEIVSMMVETLGQIITGRRSIDELGGPLKIAQVSGQQLSLGWPAFISLIALISINLGFINLLPLPVLDGGHLLFYAIEAVRRRPVGPKAQEWAFRGGLAAILALMILVTVNDLSAFGVWKGLAGLIG